MKKTVLFLLLLTSNLSFAQDRNWAVGFRAGEPLGFNIRKYIGYSHAFDLNMGTYGFLYRKNVPYKKGTYESTGISVQGHYHWTKSIDKQDRFWVYYGFGGQINSRVHRDKNSMVASKISLGPSGAAGIEYFRPEDKLSFFLDTGLYLEAIPSPLFWNPSIAAGLRVNLRK